MDPLLFVIVVAAAFFISLLLTIYIFFFVGNYKFDKSGGFKEDLKRMINEIYIPTPRESVTEGASLSNECDGAMPRRKLASFNLSTNVVEPVNAKEQDIFSTEAHVNDLESTRTYINPSRKDGFCVSSKGSSWPYYDQCEQAEEVSYSTASINDSKASRESSTANTLAGSSARGTASGTEKSTFYESSSVTKDVSATSNHASSLHSSDSNSVNHWVQNELFTALKLREEAHAVSLQDKAWDVNSDRIYSNEEACHLKLSENIPVVNEMFGTTELNDKLQKEIKAQAMANVTTILNQDEGQTLHELSDSELNKLNNDERNVYHEQRSKMIKDELSAALEKCKSPCINLALNATPEDIARMRARKAKLDVKMAKQNVKSNCHFSKLGSSSSKSHHDDSSRMFSESDSVESSIESSPCGVAVIQQQCNKIVDLCVRELAATEDDLNEERKAHGKDSPISYEEACDKLSKMSPKDRRMMQQANQDGVFGSALNDDGPTVNDLKILMIMPVLGVMASIIYIVYAVFVLIESMSFNVLFSVGIAGWFLYLCLKLFGFFFFAAVHKQNGDSEHKF